MYADPEDKCLVCFYADEGCKDQLFLEYAEVRDGRYQSVEKRTLGLAQQK